MANITYYAGLNAFTYQDLYSLTFEDVIVTTLTTTQIAGRAGGFYTSIGGLFTFDAFGLSGGRMFTATITYNGSPVASIQGVNLDIIDVAFMSPWQLERAMLAGSDVLTSHWNVGDYYNLHGGNDEARLGNGNDFVDGGTGVDTLHLSASFDSSIVALKNNGDVEVFSAQGLDTLRSVEIVRFTDQAISIRYGTGRGDVMTGDVNPGIVRDFFMGGAGGDKLYGRTGADRILGQGGNDILNGEAGDDLLMGHSGADILIGGFGLDSLRGGGGDDRLDGGRGNDILFGEAGNDRLIAGAGDDTMTGGAGRDIFQFRRAQDHNTITDFELGFDRIAIGKGAGSLADLTFQRKGPDVLVSFAGTEILVEDIRVAELKVDANFLF